MRAFALYRSRWPWMILNGVIALILRFSLNSIALLADYIIVVEDRPIMSVKYCLPVSVFHFWPKLMYPAARSLCDSWTSCFCCWHKLSQTKPVCEQSIAKSQHSESRKSSKSIDEQRRYSQLNSEQFLETHAQTCHASLSDTPVYIQTHWHKRQQGDKNPRLCPWGAELTLPLL